MSRNSLAAIVLACASLALAGAARAETDPLRDPAVARIRDAFKVDGIALFDAHSLHAPRMGVCAPSIFPALKWCVSGTAEEKKGPAAYIKTTGYNIDAESRIVYAISSRRSYPLKREEFDGIVQAIGERYGAGAALYAFKRKSEEGAAEGTGVDSLIAVWGGIRLVHLSEAEYAVVEGGGSLKRGHLVDHRFNLVTSAKQREPVYKIEGDAGFILHIMATSPDRADVIARAVYQPVFLPPAGKPSAEANNPLVTESVRRPTANGPSERDSGRLEERTKRIEAERGLAAERLLREEAERKSAEERTAREDAERKLREAEGRAKKAEDELKAKEEGRRKEEGERKAAEEKAAGAEERATRAERERMSSEERRRAEEADRKQAEERAKRAELERKAVEERRRTEEAERKAAEDRAKRAEAERKILEERRRKEEAERKSAEDRAKRAEDERKSLEERQRKETAERKAAEERRSAEDQKRAKDEAERKAAEERRGAEERRSADEKARRAEGERAAEDARKSADDPSAAERRAEAERLARERAARPESWRARAADAAKAAGAIWSFSETQDKVADERTLRSQTIFGGPDQPANGQPGNGNGNGRLAVEVTFECTIVAGERRLRAFARGFDRKSGAGVAFRTEAEGTFGVRTRFSLDDQAPQDGLLFRERQDDMASLLEIPMTSADLGKKAPRAGIWLRHYAAAVEFNLVSGTVPATITPYADNLRRVLEACAL